MMYEASQRYETGVERFNDDGNLTPLLESLPSVLALIERVTPTMDKKFNTELAKKMPDSAISDLISRIEEFTAEYRKDPRNFEVTPEGATDADHTQYSYRVLAQILQSSVENKAIYLNPHEYWHKMTSVLLTLDWIGEGIVINDSYLSLCQEELVAFTKSAWQWIVVYEDVLGHPYD